MDLEKIKSLFLDARNSTVHLYNKTASRKVYDQIKDFPAFANKLANKVKKEFLD